MQFYNISCAQYIVCSKSRRKTAVSCPHPDDQFWQVLYPPLTSSVGLWSSGPFFSFLVSGFQGCICARLSWKIGCIYNSTHYLVQKPFPSFSGLQLCCPHFFLLRLSSHFRLLPTTPFTSFIFSYLFFYVEQLR